MRNLTKSDKINYIVENKMVSSIDLEGKELPFNEEDIRGSLNLLDEKDLNPIICEWEKNEVQNVVKDIFAKGGNKNSERGVLNHGEGWEG